MRMTALRARPRRRGLPRDDGARSPSVAPNLLDRQFAAERPNQRRIADFTYIWTAEGWLYVAAVIDLFSRRVVGWSMKAEMTAQLVTDALVMAIWRRGRPNALLHHSDSQRINASFPGGLALIAMDPSVRLAPRGARCGLTHTQIDQPCLSPDLSAARNALR